MKALGLALLLVATAAWADCYDELTLAAYRPAPIREVVVAVDATTVLPEALAADLRRTLAETLRPGDRVNLIGFSAFSRQHYLRAVYGGDLEQAPSEQVQRTMPMRRVEALKRCVLLKHARTVKTVQDEVGKLLQGASDEIPKSEIVMSLREIGARLRGSTIADKVLLVVSDGLEHSNLTTFYRNRGLREIDPAAELSRVRQERLFADFQKARVYFFGGGLASAEGHYRDASALLALETFWLAYVKQSNGEAIAFGKPALLEKIR